MGFASWRRSSRPGGPSRRREAIKRATGVSVGHRQVEELARSAAVDFEGFYAQGPRPKAADGEVVVISADGKGVAMRAEDLRPAAAKARQEAAPKLKARRSKGEKPCKRMAEVAAVYAVEPAPRSAAEVIASHHDGPKEAPEAKDEWLTASVVEDAAAVIAEAFREAERRDPDHARPWVALVDGNNHQIARIKAEAKRRNVAVTIVVDLLHVLSYLWDAAWCFFPEGDPRAEEWVTAKVLAVLEGKAGLVAAVRRKATNLRLQVKDRKNADTCQLPARQGSVPRLPQGSGERVAGRNGRHRRRMSVPGEGQARPEWRTMAPRRRRSHPQATGAPQERRLGAVLVVPLVPRAKATPRAPLPRRRHPRGRLTVPLGAHSRGGAAPK